MKTVKTPRSRWLVIKPFVKFAIVLVLLFLFYLGFLNYTEPTQVGVVRNLVTGNMWLQDRAGWHISPPWVLVARIDTRPLRVAVTTTGRGFSAKLVQFDPKYWREFVAVEGFRYYWWGNRISFNFGYNEEYRGMKDIMRGYAYSAKHYSFIKILNEYQQN
jgi:hypothetical protein